MMPTATDSGSVRLGWSVSLALQTAGGLSAALGLAVLAGWGSLSLFSAPLPANVARLSTTVALCLTGAALLAAGRGARTLALACGVLIELLALTGLASALVGSHADLDDLVPSATTANFAETFARAGPLAMVLAGIAVLLLTTRRQHGPLAGLLGSIIGSWGAAALVGALAGLRSAHWGEAGQFAGGLGLLSAGAGLVIWTWQLLRHERASRVLLAPVLVAAAVLSATFYFWQALNSLEEGHLVRTVELAAEHMRGDVQAELESRVLDLLRMARRWELQGPPRREDWESDAGLYLVHYTGYHALAWVDPGYEARWVVPRNSDAAAVPLNDAAGRARTALEQARSTRRTVISRVIDLPRVGKVILVCLPIYYQGRFDGFIAGVFRLQALLDAILANTNIIDYGVTFAESGERIYSRSEAAAVSRRWCRTVRIEPYGAAWTARLCPHASLLARQQSHLPGLALAAGLLLAALSSLSVQLAQTAGRRAREAETANRELERARDLLEERVRERTAELARANQDLTAQIAERNRAEDTLRASEQRYRELFDNANDLVYVHDLHGRFLALNKAAQRLTGYTLEEARDLDLARLIAADHLELARSMIARKLGGEQTAPYELSILTKDGRSVLLELNTHLVYREGTPVAVQGIARDITERKRLEEQLRQSQKMEAVGRLAGGIAHDFNNLLTVIGAYTQMIMDGLEQNERLLGYSQEILWAAERASALTNQLLAFSRRQVVQPKLLDLNEVVLAMDNMLRRLIGEDIELVTALQPGLARIKADPSQIEQVVMNLAVNARDAMHTGGRLTLRTANLELAPGDRCTQGGLAPGAYVLLVVGDTGLGMDAEILSHLFEPFFTTKETGKGTGLGLSTVYGIVKQAGGDISVDSTAGKGSTFTIYFPATTERGADERAVPAIAGARVHGERETVLLVEDEHGVRNLVRKMLLQHAYRVLEARDGMEALRLTNDFQGTIHVLLTDVVMPKMSGRELAERLAGRYPQMKVLYMTGYTEDAIVRHGVSDKGFAMLKKPFLAEDLARKLREVLAPN